MYIIMLMVTSSPSSHMLTPRYCHSFESSRRNKHNDVHIEPLELTPPHPPHPHTITHTNNIVYATHSLIGEDDLEFLPQRFLHGCVYLCHQLHQMWTPEHEVSFHIRPVCGLVLGKGGRGGEGRGGEGRGGEGRGGEGRGGTTAAKAIIIVL